MVSYGLTILLDGVSFGMILFVISVGLTVTMGLMRVVNLAHGSFAMGGGYVAAALTQQGWNFYVSCLVAMVVCGAIGGILEMTIIRPLYRKGELAQVLLTIGVVFIAGALIRVIFGSLPFPMKFPNHLHELVDIGFRTYPAYRLFVLAVGGVIAAILWYVVEYSLIGAKLRAAVDNANMARAIGLNVGLLFTGTFVVGSALAALGGAIGAGMLSLEPTYALKYIVYFLIVVIVGGEGSFKGSFVAAIALGLIDTMGRYFIPDAATYMLYVAVFVLLLWRPQGILPPKSAS